MLLDERQGPQLPAGRGILSGRVFQETVLRRPARSDPGWGVPKDTCLPRGLDIMQGVGEHLHSVYGVQEPTVIADNVPRNIASAQALAKGLGLPSSAVEVIGWLFYKCHGGEGWLASAVFKTQPRTHARHAPHTAHRHAHCSHTAGIPYDVKLNATPATQPRSTAARSCAAPRPARRRRLRCSASGSRMWRRPAISASRWPGQKL